MNLLSKVSYYKIQALAAVIEIRSTLNVLGLCSDQRAEKKNKEDFSEVVRLAKNLNGRDTRKMVRSVKKHTNKKQKN